MRAKEEFAASIRPHIAAIEAALLRLPDKEFQETYAYDLFGRVCDIKVAGKSFSYDDIVDVLKLMERVLMCMQLDKIGIDMKLVECFIEFGQCVSELMSDVFDDEALIEECWEYIDFVGCTYRY
jgi:chemotaxis protein histidine kinase CheA